MVAHYIYVLTDPRFAEGDCKHIRYVGVSNNPKKRLKDHHKDFRGSHKASWFKNLRDECVEAKMEVIESFQYRNDANSAEIYWIAQFKAWGFCLTNATEGGEGVIGYKYTPEQIEANRQAQLRPDVYIKRAAKVKEALSRPEVQANIKLNAENRIGKFVGGKSVRSKRIKCVDTGTVFNALSEAVTWLKSIGINQAADRSLSATINGSQCTAYGYRWEFVDQPVKRKVKTQRFPVICVETGNEFKTIYAAVGWLLSTGLKKASAGNISRCARGKCPLAYGFSWKYVVQ